MRQTVFHFVVSARPLNSIYNLGIQFGRENGWNGNLKVPPFMTGQFCFPQWLVLTWDPLIRFNGAGGPRSWRGHTLQYNSARLLWQQSGGHGPGGGGESVGLSVALILAAFLWMICAAYQVNLVC